MTGDVFMGVSAMFRLSNLLFAAALACFASLVHAADPAVSPEPFFNTPTWTTRSFRRRASCSRRFHR